MEEGNRWRENFRIDRYENGICRTVFCISLQVQCEVYLPCRPQDYFCDSADAVVAADGVVVVCKLLHLDFAKFVR